MAVTSSKILEYVCMILVGIICFPFLCLYAIFGNKDDNRVNNVTTTDANNSVAVIPVRQVSSSLNTINYCLLIRSYSLVARPRTYSSF